MKRFTALFHALDSTNKTSEKVAAMEQYFRDAPPGDAAWALFFLSGLRLKGVVGTRILRTAALASSGLPEWLLDECYEAVGDLSETISLILPPADQAASDASLKSTVESRIIPLLRAPPLEAGLLIKIAWRTMDRAEVLVFNKLLRGNFRLGVQKALVVRALSAALDVPEAVLSHRLSGHYDPTPAAFEALSAPGDPADLAARPFPFSLAYQLDRPAADLGDPADWQIEHKWDGIRAQILRRDALDSGVVIWSRGEEIITHQFPELAAAARALPSGTVLDGEILAWRFDHGPDRSGGRALSFNALQTRLNRKHAPPSLFDQEGIVFIAFDLLELAGEDLRALPLRDRFARLEATLTPIARTSGTLRLPAIPTHVSWDDAERLRVRARDEHGAEGLMLKHRGSVYHPGRVAGGTAASIALDGGRSAGWWKWKVDPYSIDAVLIYAQQGSGKRAGLYSDYTFGLWDPDPSGKLVAFAKAYSGLSDEEIRRVDAFIRNNALERKGPVRIVKPELVFEIAFESIRQSPRHKAGIAVRFPRMARWRTDKKPKDADTLTTLRALLNAHPV